MVIVIRQAYNDCPEYVITLRAGQTTEQVVEQVYGKVTFGNGGFDTADGRSYLLDEMTPITAAEAARREANYQS